MPFGTFIQDFIICGSPDIHLLGDFCGAQTFDAQRQNAAAVYSGLAAESNAFCPSLQSTFDCALQYSLSLCLDYSVFQFENESEPKPL